jgi:hypothetical protein
MASYQNDANKGGYEPINSNGIHPTDKGKSTKKWIISGVVVVVVGVILAVAFHKPAGASTNAAMAKSGLPLNDDGSIMLFDKLSEFVHGSFIFNMRKLAV